MLRRHHIVLATAVCLLGAQTVFAHFLWVVTDPASGKVRVYFSEAAEPDNPALLDKVVKAEAWVAGGRGEPKGVALAKGSDALEGTLDAGSAGSTVFLKHSYGVISKGGSEPFLLQYSAKAYPFPLPGGWRAVKDEARLPLEVTPQFEGERQALLVSWKGKPLAGATVTVSGPGIEGTREGTTDENGLYTCPLTTAGTFSIRAKHVENVAGEVDGKAYKSIRHYSTLTLPRVPDTLSPRTHSYPALTKGTTSFGGAVWGDAVYVYGGNYGSAHEYTNEEQSGDLWRLKLTGGDTWKKVTEGPRLQGLAMIAHHGALYRVGGFTAQNKSGEKQDLRSQAAFAKFVVSEPQGEATWQELPALPEGRSSHDAAVLGDRLYVVGGWCLKGKGGDSKWHDTALVCDLSANPLAWREIAAPPFKRRALSIAAHQGKLYCVGGMQESGQATTRVAIYDPQNDKWSEGPAVIGSGLEGFGSSSFAVGDRLFTTTISGAIQRLAADGSKWEFAGQLAEPRFFHRLLPWKQDLVAVGGASMMTGKVESVEIVPVPTVQAAAKR